MKKISAEEIENFNKRLELLEEEDSENDFPIMVLFPEIKIMPEQLQVINEAIFGMSEPDIVDYYKSKLHGKIILASGRYTSKEDQPDFQDIFNLGIEALKNKIKK